MIIYSRLKKMPSCFHSTFYQHLNVLLKVYCYQVPMEGQCYFPPFHLQSHDPSSFLPVLVEGLRLDWHQILINHPVILKTVRSKKINLCLCFTNSFCITNLWYLKLENSLIAKILVPSLFMFHICRIFFIFFSFYFFTFFHLLLVLFVSSYRY